MPLPCTCYVPRCWSPINWQQLTAIRLLLTIALPPLTLLVLKCSITSQLDFFGVDGCVCGPPPPPPPAGDPAPLAEECPGTCNSIEVCVLLMLLLVAACFSDAERLKNFRCFDGNMDESPCKMKRNLIAVVGRVEGCLGAATPVPVPHLLAGSQSTCCAAMSHATQ